MLPGGGDVGGDRCAAVGSRRHACRGGAAKLRLQPVASQRTDRHLRPTLLGYHNEHHDLVKVPWVYLPRVKAMAPEFYDHLYAHRSWTRVLRWFLFDPRVDLYTRITRHRDSMRAARQAAAA